MLKLSFGILLKHDTMMINKFASYLNLTLLLFVFSSNSTNATQPEQNAINFQEISDYAVLANAAYLTEAEMRKLVAKNYRVEHYSNIPELQISYFLLTDDTAKSQILAVRGTANMENAIVDISLKLTLDKHTGIQLHSGFFQAAKAIYTEIKPHLKTDYVINTTGHSLGGAVALILAMKMDVDHFKVGRVITFGQPKVSNVAGAGKFQHLNLVRVVTPKDMVPLAPPLDPLDLANLDIYWHSGKEVVLLPDTDYAILEGVDSMLRATKFTQETLDENNVTNHQMSLYMALVDKKISGAKLVPYKNSFNLFNLF